MVSSISELYTLNWLFHAFKAVIRVSFLDNLFFFVSHIILHFPFSFSFLNKERFSGCRATLRDFSILSSSWNISLTLLLVLAEVSIKLQFHFCAWDSPSAVGTSLPSSSSVLLPTSIMGRSWTDPWKETKKFKRYFNKNSITIYLSVDCKDTFAS